MPTDKPRVTFMVEEDLLEQINDYKFEHRIKNQSQAIVALIAKGLSAVSGADCLIEDDQPALTKDESELLSLYRELNQAGQELALTTLRTFAGNPSMQKDAPHATAM